MEYPPHSGYHWQGQSPFFEGWYVRLILPESGESFAFMYSIENPSGDRPYSGGALQILGPGENDGENKLLCRTFPSVKNFWASPSQFALGHWGKHSQSLKPQPLDPQDFFSTVTEGYQIYQNHHQGCIAVGNQECKWNFTVKPLITWGNPRNYPKATAGWLSFLPLFDPGWQIVLAQGTATGQMEWQGKKYNLNQALVYAEKNWGRSFPSRWFWLQANYFRNHPGLSVTAAAGERMILGRPEEVGLIGIHHQGNFYEFGPDNSQLTWKVARWGHWQLTAVNSNYWLELSGQTQQAGILVHTPTARGLQLNCRDTTKGNLNLKLGSISQGLMVEAITNTAGLEVGGNWGLI